MDFLIETRRMGMKTHENPAWKAGPCLGPPGGLLKGVAPGPGVHSRLYGSARARAAAVVAKPMEKNLRNDDLITI